LSKEVHLFFGLCYLLSRWCCCYCYDSSGLNLIWAVAWQQVQLLHPRDPDIDFMQTPKMCNPTLGLRQHQQLLAKTLPLAFAACHHQLTSIASKIASGLRFAAVTASSAIPIAGKSLKPLGSVACIG
jgi:hypothetical protein